MYHFDMIFFIVKAKKFFCIKTTHNLLVIIERFLYQLIRKSTNSLQHRNKCIDVLEM